MRHPRLDVAAVLRQMVSEPNVVYLPNSNLVGGAITILKNDGLRKNGKNDIPTDETEKFEKICSKAPTNNSYWKNKPSTIRWDPLGPPGQPTFDWNECFMPGISVAPQEDPTRPTSPPGCPCPWEKLGMSSLAQHETWKSRRDFHVTSSALAVAFNFMCSCCSSMSSRNEINPYPGVKKGHQVYWRQDFSGLIGTPPPPVVHWSNDSHPQTLTDINS